MLIVRSVASAAASFAARRALMSFGIASEAMMAMIATTIISSINVNPALLFSRIFLPLDDPQAVRLERLRAGPSLALCIGRSRPPG